MKDKTVTEKNSGSSPKEGKPEVKKEAEQNSPSKQQEQASPKALEAISAQELDKRKKLFSEAFSSYAMFIHTLPIEAAAVDSFSGPNKILLFLEMVLSSFAMAELCYPGEALLVAKQTFSLVVNHNTKVTKPKEDEIDLLQKVISIYSIAVLLITQVLKLLSMCLEKNKDRREHRNKRGLAILNFTTKYSVEALLNLGKEIAERYAETIGRLSDEDGNDILAFAQAAVERILSSRLNLDRSTPEKLLESFIAAMKSETCTIKQFKLRDGQILLASEFFAEKTSSGQVEKAASSSSSTASPPTSQPPQQPPTVLSKAGSPAVVNPEKMQQSSKQKTDERETKQPLPDSPGFWKSEAVKEKKGETPKPDAPRATPNIKM